MKHPSTIWKDPSYADEPLGELVATETHVNGRTVRGARIVGGMVGEYLTHLAGRERATSPQTIEKYRKSILSFCRSIAAADEPLVLASVTPAAAARWVSQQRFKGCAAEGIASRLAAVKAFTRQYLYLEQEITTDDLLRKTKRVEVGQTAKAMLDEDERESVLGVFERDKSYEGVRNLALLNVYLATGRRFDAIRTMRADALDPVTGLFVVREKGGRELPTRIAGRPLRLVRAYLRTRRAAEGVTALWTTAEGQPLSYWGAQSVFKRLKTRSGVGRVHAHLLRHTFGQGALLKGAERALVQDAMGHESDRMTRRYTEVIRRQTAATEMPGMALV